MYSNLYGWWIHLSLIHILIYDNLRPGIEKSMCKKEEILNILKDKNIEVLITLGAGDIDNYVPEIKELLEKR